jgi:hypothetical protein
MAVRCIRLGCDVISAISSSVRDPVDRVSCADPLADHGIPSFAQSGERRPRCVRQPSCSLGQMDDARAVGSPQQVDHQRQLAAVSRGDRKRLSTAVVRTASSLRLRMRLHLRRLACPDRLLRSFVDSDGLRCQFERERQPRSHGVFPVKGDG